MRCTHSNPRIVRALRKKKTSIDFFSRYVREGACANASKNGFAAARVFITFIESGFFSFRRRCTSSVREREREEVK